jgi:tetratricopeptide (TPR) repeat protein
MKYSLLLPIAGAMAIYAPAAHALSSQEVARIAKQSTVRISSANSPGSGVIIKKEGDTYFVLTAAHVVRNRSAAFTAITADGSSAALSDIKVFPDKVDLALMRFTSTKNHSVAKLAASSNDVSEGATVYVSGFPVTSTITEAIFNFTEGKVSASSSRPMNDGYSLVYTNNTLPGHSGGPVWNDKGEVVAIHGKGDVDTKQQASEINPNIRVKTGFNLGIAINTFNSLVARVGIPSFGGVVPTVVASQPKPIDDLIVSGLAKVQQKNYGGALTDFNQAIQLDPKRASAFLYRGQVKVAQVEAKLLQESAYVSNLYGQMLNDFDQDGGVLLYKQFATEYRAALVDYNKAIQLDPKSVEALQGASQIHANLGEYAPAIKLLDRAIALRPDATSYALRAASRLKTKNQTGAEQDINQAIKLDAQNHALYNVRADMYTQRKQFDKAIQDYDQALRLVPKTERVSILGYYISRSTAKSNLKDYVGAAADITAIIDNQDAPSLKSTLYFLRGVHLFNQGKFDPALKDLNVAIQADPKNSIMYFFRGSIFFKQEKYDAASQDMQRSIQLAPDFAEAHLMQGALYALRQKWQESLVSLNRSISLIEKNPSKAYIMADAYEARGYILIVNNNRKAGFKDLERAAALYKAANNQAKYQEIRNQIAKLGGS